ncbi:Histone-lysine N-methyltransferase ehmt2, variant 2 [Balamuthia mandrillaris]
MAQQQQEDCKFAVCQQDRTRTLPQFTYIDSAVAGEGVDLRPFCIYEPCLCVCCCGGGGTCCPTTTPTSQSCCPCLARMPTPCYVRHQDGTLRLRLLLDNEERVAEEERGESSSTLGTVATTKEEEEDKDYDQPLFECWEECGCAARGGRRECMLVGQRNSLPFPLEAFHDEHKGWGMRALAAIPQASFVCEYAGEVIPTATARSRWQERSRLGLPNYLLTIQEHMHLGGKERVVSTNIDAFHKGNASRLFNHSCRPNLALFLVRSSSLIPKAAFFSLRDIAKGEELTFHYGSFLPPVMRNQEAQEVVGEERLKCLCGETKCSGYLPFVRWSE